MVYFINILLVLTIQVSRCQDKTDLEIVMLCPSSKEEWDRAAQKKNCSKFVALNAHEEQYEYHCLINAYLNETLAVCAPKKWIFGYCTEFNVAGGIIQKNPEAKCNEMYPRCDKAYSSADAYKYPDCYQIVYDERKKTFTTTYLPTTLVQSKDKEDNGNTESIAAAISVIVIVVLSIVILVVFCMKKRTRKEKKELDEEEVNLTGIKVANAIDEGEKSIEYFHFKVKNFEHFIYIYNLTRNYTSNNVFFNEVQLEDIIFKIGVVGKYTDDNLNLFPKGKTNLGGKIQNVWEAVPVLCFQNDLSFQSALETLRKSSAPHSILVTPESVWETDTGDDSITIIRENKDEIMNTITFCLEQPFRHILEQLLKSLPKKYFGRAASKRSSEINALLKEIRFDYNEETITENLPDDIQTFLSRSDGLKRAELSPYSLDLLVDKTTDEQKMKDDLTKLNPSFLERFPLTIQKGTLIKQNTGRIVKATDNDKKKNNSTRGHVVPKGKKIVYNKVRNALKKYKSDNEQENENPTDVNDSNRQKTEKNTEMVNTKTTARKEGHRCLMCNERIMEENSWEKHVIECGRKRRQKRFECTQCDYATNKKSDMQRHERTRHGGSSGTVQAESESDHEWESLDLSDMVGESDILRTIPVTLEVTKRKPTRPLPVYVPKSKAIVSPDAVVPTAPSPFATPMITPRERAAKDLTVTASASKPSTLRDFAVQAGILTVDASTQTLTSTGVNVDTQTEGTKRRRLDRVQKSYQVGGESVIEVHKDEERF